MFFQLIRSSWRRASLIFILLAILLVSFIPSAFAIPGASPDAPGTEKVMGWVDLSATVPKGFTGSVSVHLKNTDDDSYYDVESFVLNNFKNSAQVPKGNYIVEAVSTSEDPFLYDVSCDTMEFTLTNSYPLHVTVTVNDAGKAFLEGDVNVPEDEVSEESEEDEDKLVGMIEEVLSSENPDDSEIDESEKESLAEDEVIEEENEITNKRTIWEELLISVIGILIFGGIFFAIYFFSRRKYR